MSDTLALPKGYRFRFPGAPAPRIEDAPLPDNVRLSLMHPTRLLLKALVQTGDAVKTGQVVAGSEEHPTVKLVSPVTGKVTETTETHGIKSKLKPGAITIEREGEDDWALIDGASETAEEIPVERAREMLIEAGLWPSICEIPASGPLTSTEGEPQALVVKCVAVEPFVPRGHALLAGRLEDFERGLEMFQRVTSGYTRMHLILTDPMAPMAEEIREATKGRAWVSVHFAPLKYPVENPAYLFKHLFPDKASDPEFRAWFVDVQTVMAVGECLTHGKASVERVVAVAGSNMKEPQHVRVRVGTSIHQLLEGRVEEGDNRIVRGGLLTGETVDEEEPCIGPMELAINVVPEGRDREFMGFVHPGRDHDSFSRTFLSKLWPDKPRDLHTNIRGEPRPCVSCGFCEEVCPADIMPHWIYKCLETDRLEEAEQTGIELCIGCGLCSYVCPSKLNLRAQIKEGRQRLAEEKE